MNEEVWIHNGKNFEGSDKDKQVKSVDKSKSNAALNSDNQLEWTIFYQGRQINIPQSIYDNVTEMRSYAETNNRIIPRKFGNTIVLHYNSNNIPTMTIGPHYPFSIGVIIKIIAIKA